MAILVIDTGENIVGVFFVEANNFIAYLGNDILSAIRLIETADEVVTYNGKHYDLNNLGKFAGLSGNLPLNGVHTDIRSICWSDRIWGSNLGFTYGKHFDDCPSFPNTYEGSVECDVYMTFKLWELWKQGKLKILDGNDVVPST
jgi:hypothetical protein